MSWPCSLVWSVCSYMVFRGMTFDMDGTREKEEGAGNVAAVVVEDVQTIYLVFSSKLSLVVMCSVWEVSRCM